MPRPTVARHCSSVSAIILALAALPTLPIASGSTVASQSSSVWQVERGGFRDVRDLAPLSADDVWIVGSNLGHYDGVGWRAVDGRETAAGYNAIDLYGDRDGWAVGNGFAQRLHEGQWQEPHELPGAVLYDLALTSADDGWAVGHERSAGRAAYWRLDGGDWTLVPDPAIAAVDIWMTSATEGWAVGGDQVAQYDGQRWIPVELPGAKGLRAVAGSGPDDVWVGGGSEPAPVFFGPGHSQLFHYDGRSWSMVRDAEGPGISDIAVANRRGYALGFGGQLLALEDGGLQVLPATVPADRFRSARAIRLIPDQNAAVVGMSDGRIFRVQDAHVQVAHRAAEIQGIGFIGPDEGWALGKANANLVGPGPPTVALRWDGRRWSTLAQDHPLVQALAVDIDVLGQGSAWAVGPMGAILHFDGDAWTRKTSPSDASLHRVQAIAPNLVLALGTKWIGPGDVHQSVVLLYDGATWQVIGQWQGTNASVRIDDVDAVGADLVWLAAVDGLRRFDGLAWTTLAIDDMPTSVAMTGATTGWLGTSRGRMLRVVGNRVTEALKLPASSSINRIQMEADGRGWAVGWNGYVAYFDGATWTIRRGPIVGHCNCSVPWSLLRLTLLDDEGAQQLWLVGTEETILRSPVAEILSLPAITPDPGETSVPFTSVPNGTATPTPTATIQARDGQWVLWLPSLITWAAR